MARLALVGSHTVNGVAELHSKLLRTRVMKDFADLYPERFQNKTNGVTPRRWLLACNPPLASLVTERIGDGWVTDLEKLRELDDHIDADFLLRLDEGFLPRSHRHIDYFTHGDGYGVEVTSAEGGEEEAVLADHL